MRNSSIALLGALFGASLLLAGACGGSNDNSDKTAVSRSRADQGAPATTVAAQPTGSAAASSPTAGATGGATQAAGQTLQISAKDIAYSTDKLTAKAGAVTIEFTNNDSATSHNFALYNSPDSATNEIGHTDIAPGPNTKSLTVTLQPGTYHYECQVHPTSMRGTLTVS
ncbi:MAG TPA: cupredoxin domain-containing protein [Dehalococcoidia bacterium]|nr:cupredoxin domain-containing protein [Dehalococcoidia bacterium]